MARISGIDDGGSGGVTGAVTRFGGIGFRFTLRLSHARIAGHGLRAVSRAGALRFRGDTIGGGTSEIMKNILAERVLGLPKD